MGGYYFTYNNFRSNLTPTHHGAGYISANEGNSEHISIPFSEIKEFRVYNPWIKKFPEEWVRMSKREREAKEILESDYDIILKNGKVIKMSGWTTAFYFSKNLPSVRKIREFQDILLQINKELKKR